MPASITHLNLIQSQPDRPSRTPCHRKHQLTRNHLELEKYTPGILIINHFSISINVCMDMNEWINDVFLYSTLLCIAVHPKCFTIIWGGGALLNHHLDDVTAATGQRRQAGHQTPATGGEEREWWSQSSGWRLLGSHNGQGPVAGIWPGHRGYTPTLLFTRSPMWFLMTTESQDLGLTSHPKDSAFSSIVSPSLYWSIRTHTPQGMPPCWSH